MFDDSERSNGSIMELLLPMATPLMKYNLAVRTATTYYPAPV
jgi:hypothetical protein